MMSDAKGATPETDAAEKLCPQLICDSVTGQPRVHGYSKVVSLDFARTLESQRAALAERVMELKRQLAQALKDAEDADAKAMEAEALAEERAEQRDVQWHERVIVQESRQATEHRLATLTDAAKRLAEAWRSVPKMPASMMPSGEWKMIEQGDAAAAAIERMGEG